MAHQTTLQPQERAAPPADGPEEADEPQAARIVPSADAETPRTLARTSTCWRVIRPDFASS